MNDLEVEGTLNPEIVKCVCVCIPVARPSLGGQPYFTHPASARLS